MRKPTQAKRLGSLLGRGALGGAISGLVVGVALLNPITVGNSWLFWLPISYVFFELPSGLLIGTIIATTIWLVHRRTVALLGPLIRAAIGTLIALVCWGVFFLLRSQSDHVATSLGRYVGAIFFFGTTTGVITGLIVGAPASERRDEKRIGVQKAIIESESNVKL